MSTRCSAIARHSVSSKRSGQSAQASLPSHPQTRWQKHKNNVSRRSVMADQNKTSPKKHGTRVHRYGPQSNRRRITLNETTDNNQIATTVSVLNNNTATTAVDRPTAVTVGDSNNNASAVGIPREESPNDNDGLPQRLDGDGSSFSDREEQDPELEELAKLRCPSERTEVIAEREQRRRGRRCADYPGLAFGSSIFSSDTLMKFSIIKNELHNILNSQLKRVSTKTRYV